MASIDSRWTSPLDEGQQAAALAAAGLIAGRVTDPDQVAASLALAAEQTNYPMTVRWDPTTVAQGDAGIALLCAQLDDVWPGKGWDNIAATHVAAAVRALRGRPLVPAGAVSGLAGMLFVAGFVDEDELQRIVPDLSARVARSSLETAAAIRGVSGISVGAFDLISGLSGVLACVLPRGDTDLPPIVPFLERALVAMALLDDGLPACHTPPELLYDDEQRAYYPSGNVNVGLAHGIPGPLAALSIAHIAHAAKNARSGTSGVGAGAAEPDRVAAITQLSDWLGNAVVESPQGPGWPTVIPLVNRDGRRQPVAVDEVGRDAWCYGTPGAARALYLAGAAVDRPDWCDLATAAMAAVYQRPVPARMIDSPTFCHGVAGLLQITLRFHHDTRLPMFAEAARTLTAQILETVDPDRPMAVANLEPGGNPVDQPGVLDGAAGVSLVLLSAATDLEPEWDRIFALA